MRWERGRASVTAEQTYGTQVSPRLTPSPPAAERAGPTCLVPEVKLSQEA